jgi:acyl-CoA dehydrogenase
MDFGVARTLYDTEHEIFRSSVRQFLEAEVVPHYADWEEAGQTPREIWLRAGEMGLLGTSIPEAYGGSEGGFLYDAIVIEELGRLGIAAPAWDMHAHIVSPIIVGFGSEDQKRDWLPSLVKGEKIISIGLSEPDGGSDLKALRTTAKLDGNHYVVNGSKTFITNGIIGDVVLLAVKTAPELGAKGISLLLVDSHSDGFKKGRNLKKVGNKAQDTAELFFDDLRVPATNMIGQENEGWRILWAGLARERMVVAIRSMAIAEAALDMTIEYTKQRKAFDQAIFEFQNTQFKLAEMATEIEVGRPFVDRCIAMVDDGTLTPETAAKAKLWTTELQGRVVDECVQLHGGYGYMWEFPITRLWADSRIHRIYAGTNEIMKYIIGRSL